MKNMSNKNLLASYVDANYPIIFINHFEFHEIDELIDQVSSGKKVLEYNNALGMLDFKTKCQIIPCDLEKFLNEVMDEGYDKEVFAVLKDIQKDIDNPKICALLRRIAELTLYTEGYSVTVFMCSADVEIPCELENYTTIFEMPKPTVEEISSHIKNFADVQHFDISPEFIDKMALSLKGFSYFQISQILNLAYQNDGFLDESDMDLIKEEKKQIIKKSGMLELVDVKDTIDDIGGLENLKKWLKNKAEVFRKLDKALKFGVDIPKGVLILGMPGCGKSLTAKATSILFDMPLVRLDVGRLLGKYVGESENNMRRALALSESISPCVLWIDEIEKAFSGVGDSDVTTRLFGQFITWLQEKDNSVFIVATANQISNLPPEFLRKGRFDEIFFVDLPNVEERRNILEIHLRKRSKELVSLDLNNIVYRTNGYSGSELESVVKEAFENAFINGKNKITTSEILKVIDYTKPLSKIMEDKVGSLKRQLEQIGVRKASK